MVAEVAQPLVQAAEWKAVRRQDQRFRRHRLEAAERVEIEPERVEPGLLGPHAHVGRDLREHLVARDQEAACLVQQARVLGRVAEDNEHTEGPETGVYYGDLGTA